MVDQSILNEVLSALKLDLTAEILQPGDPSYIAAVKLWNKAVNIRPAFIVMCENSRDVSITVSVSRRYNLKLTVKGGGHDCTGLALCEDGIVIDLSKMRNVEIDVENAVAVIEGGVTAMDLLLAAEPRGFIAVTGTGSTIGMAGLTLGGGYGLLTSKYGLALDQLLGVDIVLADGTVQRADEYQNKDLFWALRGGGGNFGVIVSMTVKLHAAEPILFGNYLYSGEEAEPALKHFDEIASGAPESISVVACIQLGDYNRPVVRITLNWCGDVLAGELFFASVTIFGRPVFEGLSRLTYKDTLLVYDDLYRSCFADMKTRWLVALSDESVKKLFKAFGATTPSLSSVAIQYFYGAPTRVALNATAFGLRERHIMVLISSAWTQEENTNAALHANWGATLSNALAPYSYPGGYINVLSNKEPEQLRFAFGENLTRLQQIKSFYDPEGVFNSFPIYLQEADCSSFVHR